MAKATSILVLIVISLVVFVLPVQAQELFENFATMIPNSEIGGQNGWLVSSGVGYSALATTTDFITSYTVGALFATSTTETIYKPITLSTTSDATISFKLWPKRPNTQQGGDLGIALQDNDKGVNLLNVLVQDYLVYGDNTILFQVNNAEHYYYYEYDENYPIIVSYSWFTSATTSFILSVINNENSFNISGNRLSEEPDRINLQSSNIDNGIIFFDDFYLTGYTAQSVDSSYYTDYYGSVDFTEVPGMRHIVPALETNFPFNVLWGIYSATASSTPTTASPTAVILNSPTTSPITYSFTLFSEEMFDHFELGLMQTFKTVLSMFLWLYFVRYVYMRVRNFFQADTISLVPRLSKGSDKLTE